MLILYTYRDKLLPSSVLSNQTEIWGYAEETYYALMNVTEFSDELRQRYIEYYRNPTEHQLMCGVSRFLSDLHSIKLNY